MASILGGPLKSPMLVLGALLLCAVVVRADIKLIDDEDEAALKSSVCGMNLMSSAQIGKVSTMKKLFYILGRQNDPSIISCRKKYSELVEQLYSVASNYHPACSENKIHSIKRFHSNYISTTKRDRKHQKINYSIPKILKKFFFHYTTEIATICKRVLIERLDEASAKNEGKALLQVGSDVEQIDKFFNDFSKKLGATASGSGKGYDDIALFWNYIKRLPLDDSDKFVSLYGKKYIAFEVKNSTNLQEFQKECRTRLKPIYQNLAMPVLELIDLGYYLNDEPFAEQLATRPDLKRLISVAQFCEFILPIRLMSNSRLAEGQIHLLGESYTLSNREEEEEADPILEFEDGRDSLKGLDALPNVTPQSAGTTYQQIKANIAGRQKALRNVFVRLGTNIMDKAKSMFARPDNTNKLTVDELVSQPTKESSGSTFMRNVEKDMVNIKDKWLDFPPAAIVLTPLFMVKWVINLAFMSIRSLCKLIFLSVSKPIFELVQFYRGGSLLHAAPSGSIGRAANAATGN